MGIKKLTELIEDNAPSAIKTNDLKSYSGRIVAIDASTSMYQFLIAINTEMGASLMNANGETTSHLQGMFNRTIKLITRGIKPIYVFDGKAPVLKSGELAKRYARRKEAEQQLEEANEIGNNEEVAKLQKRTISASRKQNEECKKLLELMGVPIIQAPCEAEAQCAELCKGGKAWATGSEDMDSLTLGSTILLRRLNFSEARKLPIMEIELQKVLDGLDLSHDEFIDLCILLGCDYCDTIKGIGPKKSFDLITKYKTIENVLQNLDHAKYPIPESFPINEVRDLFKNPNVTKCQDIPDIVWKEPDAEGIIKFLVGEMGFNEQRVQHGIEKLKKYKDTGVQTRIDTFFQLVKRPRDEDGGAAKKRQKSAKPAAGTKKKPAATKRK